MRIYAAFVAVTLVLPAPTKSIAHEFWIEPLDYQIEADGMVQGRLVNGQAFAGVELSFLPQRFDRFTIASDTREAPVENRLGAKPALDIAPLAEGLNIVSYQSTLSTLTYAEWEKFLSFAEHKDFQDIEAIHDARGLPRDGFREGYWRYSKALIGVGDATGEDFRTGLATEFVALDNPYTDDLLAGLRVQLYYLDDRLTDAQVELFEKAPDGTVDVTLHRTDADGIATLPVKPGHSYLVDHVTLRQPSAELAEQSGIVWETLWAALTFAVPAR